MRLAEGCRGDGCLVEPGVGARERDAELGLRGAAYVGEGHRRDLVLQALELFRDLGRQHVEARRHELPDLDHEAAEFDREHVEPLREALHARRPGALGDRAHAEAR